MRIEGLQKLTLLDYPGLTACTVFLAGCNLRCPFCHNAPLVLPGRGGESAPLSRAELTAYLQKRRGVLQGVCVTGGEPLLNDDLEDLLREIRSLGFRIKLDTNGTRPDRLEKIAADGLADYVAMDIKNQPLRYAETVGLPGFDIAPVLESAGFLLRGGIEYEFRTTVVRELHSRQDFEVIGRWLAGAKRYYLQQFVDSGDLIGSGLHACPREQMEGFRSVLLNRIPSARLRGV